MSTAPDVDVIVIAYNECTTILDAVGALRAQETDLDVEVLVVDDGSTDGTGDLVRGAFADDPKVRVLDHGSNRGRGAARRTGQDAAGASMIGYVDADVIVPPGWVARCATALADHDAVSGITSPDGDCVTVARLSGAAVRRRAHTRSITGANVLFRAESLRKVGFDERSRLGEDFRLTTAMTELGMSLATLPDLHCEHLEDKTYARSTHWMWENGLDAATLPGELGTVRAPDITWFGWLCIVVASIVRGAVGLLRWPVATAAALAATVAVAVGHTASRFDVRPAPSRWLAAALLDVPPIGAYLVGRTAALPRVVERFVARRVR